MLEFRLTRFGVGAEAFRSVMIRGWGLEHEVVLGGFVSIAVFGFGMVALASRSLRP